jgi:hypothetical protein
MIIKMEQLSEFVEFLRQSCGVRQITSFHPAPNEAGEFFRALAENHWVIAHLNHTGDLCIFSDDQYQIVLWDRWTKLQRNKPTVPAAAVSIFATERLKSLLLGSILPAKTAAERRATTQRLPQIDTQASSTSTRETIDLA